MATLGEFGSILQLGFGIGIGLSYFRAPVDLRTSSLREAIRDEISIVQGIGTAKAQQKLANMSSLLLAFTDEVEKLERWQFPFMMAAILGAVANWIGLIAASLYAAHVLTRFEKLSLLIISVGYYVFLLGALEIIARYRLRTVRLRLADIRSS